jgi:hypothetical protein
MGLLYLIIHLLVVEKLGSRRMSTGNWDCNLETALKIILYFKGRWVRDGKEGV